VSAKDKSRLRVFWPATCARPRQSSAARPSEQSLADISHAPRRAGTARAQDQAFRQFFSALRPWANPWVSAGRPLGLRIYDMSNIEDAILTVESKVVSGRDDANGNVQAWIIRTPVSAAN
jgi:hypothetical protein